MPTVLKHDQKSAKTSKSNPNSDEKANQTLSTSRSGSKDKDKDKSKSSGNQNQQKKPDLTDNLRKDSKLTAQERQQRLDNELYLLCGKSGYMEHDRPKSTKARAAKASDPKSFETKPKSLAKASKAKN